MYKDGILYNFVFILKTLIQIIYISYIYNMIRFTYSYKVIHTGFVFTDALIK